MNTNYNIKNKTAVKWLNGHCVNWNSDKLRLSQMVPNGCDTTFANGQLAFLERAVNGVLNPFFGTKDWTSRAPIGAIIVLRSISIVGMYSCCYCYGDDYKTSRYYEEYLGSLMRDGKLSRKVAESEVKKLLDIFHKYFKENSKIAKNVYTDDEGVVYNSMTCKQEKMNVIIDPQYCK